MWDETKLPDSGRRPVLNLTSGHYSLNIPKSIRICIIHKLQCLGYEYHHIMRSPNTYFSIKL